MICLLIIVAVTLSAIIIPQILVVVFRKHLFDTLDNQKIHTEIVPCLGILLLFFYYNVYWDSASFTMEQQEAIAEYQNVVDNPYQ